MEYMKISRLTEDNFTEIINSAGGSKIQESTIPGEQSCDYTLKEALIELKIIEEEPAEKIEKQQKLSALFGKNYETVIIEPSRLDTEEERFRYYEILETSIKTGLKKASKQLQVSSKSDPTALRIAVVINNGLSMTLPDEFEEIAIRKCKNDTSGIDVLVVGGIYYYSDFFDNYLFSHFAVHEIRKEPNSITDSLRHEWRTFIEKYMTDIIKKEANKNADRKPVQDIIFNIDGIRYVKPSPHMGERSKFWPAERQRNDTTGMTKCPAVAKIIPILSELAYNKCFSSFSDKRPLRSSHKEYTTWTRLECELKYSHLMPFIGIDVPDQICTATSFEELYEIASRQFQSSITSILKRATEYSDDHVSINYIFLLIQEIGRDKANDIAWIEHRIETPGFERVKVIIDGKRMKYEYAIVLAAMHCIRLGANSVYFTRDTEYKWK